MLQPALEEYKLLRSDLAEIRTQITRYMGFIIALSGGAAALSQAFTKDQNMAVGMLLVTFITMTVGTLLFEIIWYKFRSHNRHAGYIQMLSHEIGYWPISVVNDDKQYKEYLDTLLVEYYKERNKEGNNDMIDFITGLNEVHSWELVLSRYRKSLQPGREQSFRQLAKAKYAYALGRTMRYSDFREHDGHLQNRNADGGREDYDISFYEEIISNMTQVPDVGAARRVWIGFVNILRKRTNPDQLHRTPKGMLMSGYHFLGWTYPRKLTQIGLIAMSMMFVFACFEACKHHWMLGIDARTFNWEVTFEVGALISGTVVLMLIWLGRYAYGIIDLESRGESIDYYCWKLLPFRVQFLNGRGIIPLYFSRDFIRFMKSRKLLHALHGTKADGTVGQCAACRTAEQPLFKSAQHSTPLCAGCRDSLIEHYTYHRQFEEERLMRGHGALAGQVFVNR